MSSQSKPDYYKVLEIERSASHQEIIDAYKRLALVRHPDKNPGDPNACAAFQELQSAYEQLSLQEHWSQRSYRTAYDYSQFAETTPQPPPPPSPPGSFVPPMTQEEEEQILKEHEVVLAEKEKNLKKLLKRANKRMDIQEQKRKDADDAFSKGEQDAKAEAAMWEENPPSLEQLLEEKNLRRRNYQQLRANIDPYYIEAKKRCSEYDKRLEKLMQEWRALKFRKVPSIYRGNEEV